MVKGRTRRSIIGIVLLIAFSAVTVTGGTLAWFFDQTDVIDNTFTAGTVDISAEETVSPPDAVMENWNPGDEAYKEYTVTNQGSKAVYLRGVINGQWYQADGFTPWNPDSNPVEWEIVPELSDPVWVKIGDKIVYSESLPGTYSQATVEERQVKITIRVKLDGEGSNNDFQGKVFKLEAVFEAVQSSNGAISDVWPDSPIDLEEPEEPEEPVIPEEPGDPEEPADPGKYKKFGSAWAGDTSFQGDHSIASYFSYNIGQGTKSNPVSIDFSEGRQDHLVGRVLIWNTENTLYVKVETDSPYGFKKTHMSAGLVPPGKSSPGNLGHKNESSSTLKGFTYELTSVYTEWKDRSKDRDSTLVETLEDGQMIYIAVHGEILKK